MRLGAICCAGIGTLLYFKIGELIRNERTGYYAAILYNTSIYCSIIAGTFIFPDSPQLVFWLASLFVVLKMVIQSKKNKQIPILSWLVIGLLTGVCIMCKVHGVFLWVGVGLYILIFKGEMLFLPRPYLALALVLVIISPIIVWNINNHFITWVFHSNRVEVHENKLKFDSFLQAIFGQFFYNNHINVFLLVASLIALRKK